MKRAKVKIEDIDTIELNEAFSSQVLACQKELSISDDKLNRWGGAIASGHPYGASGAALVTRLFHMNVQNKPLQQWESVEDSVMQYYLRDGEEHQRVILKKKKCVSIAIIK